MACPGSASHQRRSRHAVARPGMGQGRPENYRGIGAKPARKAAAGRRMVAARRARGRCIRHRTGALRAAHRGSLESVGRSIPQGCGLSASYPVAGWLVVSCYPFVSCATVQRERVPARQESVDFCRGYQLGRDGAESRGTSRPIGDSMQPGTESIPPHMQLIQMGTAYWHSRLIHAAAKLKLPDLLAAGPQTAEQLSAATGTHAPSLYRVMRTLASLGVFTEDDR